MADPDYLRFFPYETPYENQSAAMERIATALSHGRNVLFEGAPGTGKTLAALAPALEYAARTDKTVLITTNVHQQMRQFITEAREITRSEPIRAVVFRGKSSMCHIDVGYEECQVLRDTTHERLDLEADRRQLLGRERELLASSQAGDEDAAAARGTVMEELESIERELAALEDRRICDRYYANRTTDTAAFERWLFDDVRTPDEVYAYADENGYCGYELLKDTMGGVDLVVCNYRHLLDDAIRRQFFRWIDREPEDVIAVFDEAHNIERAARDHAVRTLSERTVDGALSELDDVDDERAGTARNVIAAFRDALVAVYEDALAAPDIGPVDTDWVDLPVENDDRRDDLTMALLESYTGSGIDGDVDAAIALGEDLDAQYEDAYRTGTARTRRESPTRRTAAFLEAYLGEAARPARYPTVSVRRDERSGTIYGRVELHTCIPREVTRGVFEDVYASVLMSATLRPFDVTGAVIGLESPETMTFGLEFPRENRRTFAVDVPPLFAADRDDPDVISTVTDVLEDAIRYTPGNALVFFPSYREAARYADRMDDEVNVFLDEPGTRVESLRRSFVDGANGALFTSVWGTLTEGVSFDGTDARSVAIVGVPYPRLDDRMEAIQRAYADAFPGNDTGWEYAVQVPTVRKIRQALGRVIRSPTDVGARLLVDRRYTAADLGRYGVRDSFPPEERAEFVDVDAANLRYAMLNFFAEHDAWDGQHPAP